MQLGQSAGMSKNERNGMHPYGEQMQYGNMAQGWGGAAWLGREGRANQHFPAGMRGGGGMGGHVNLAQKRQWMMQMQYQQAAAAQMGNMAARNLTQQRGMQNMPGRQNAMGSHSSNQTAHMMYSNNNKNKNKNMTNGGMVGMEAHKPVDLMPSEDARQASDMTMGLMVRVKWYTEACCCNLIKQQPHLLL